MEYRVEELAARAGTRVDTVRYYQARGLLAAPRREGRVAWYADAHLERLQQIRRLADDGLTLDLIRRLFDSGGAASDADEQLRQALEQTQAKGRSYSLAELASASGLPESLVRGAQAAGLLEAAEVDGEQRFGEADVEMMRAGVGILEAGFPLAELQQLALAHARSIDAVIERAIDLFDDYVRKADHADAAPGAASAHVAALFERLLPQATHLVAVHFERTLVARALRRLADSGADRDLARALEETSQRELDVSVSWRGSANR